MNEWQSLPHTHNSTQRALLRSQGNYFERNLAFLATKKLMHNLNCQVMVRGFDLLQEHPGKRVLLIPNHRSYIDPLIIHQALTLTGHKQPRVAALDFIAATPIAPLVKKCGAVFIKGSFSDPTYRDKMNQLLREYTDQGEWLEFYLEGMRSISGKQLEPRRGLLTALMTDRDCVIYPINLSYERLIEDREFISKRKGFNLKHTLQTALLPGNGIGQVHVSVCQPIHTHPGDNVAAIAQQITTAIMQANVLYSTDLLAMTLLDRQEAIEFEALQQELNWLNNAISQRGVEIADRDLNDTLRLLKHAVKYRNGVVTLLDKTLLIYYRNRMLYAISDLADAPDILRKEALWSPVRGLRAEQKQLSAMAKRALEPTIFLYKYLLDRINHGETSLKALRQAVDDNPHYCYETVSNLVNVLKEDGLVTVAGDTLTRL